MLSLHTTSLINANYENTPNISPEIKFPILVKIVQEFRKNKNCFSYDNKNKVQQYNY